MPELGGHLDLGNISNDRKMRDDKIRELVIERKKLRELLKKAKAAIDSSSAKCKAS
jgi:hypothetical protein